MLHAHHKRKVLDIGEQKQYTKKKCFCFRNELISFEGGRDEMRVKTMIILCIAVACSIPRTSEVIAGQRGEELAAKSAHEWLALVDEGKYSESWDESAQLFKAAVTKEQWKDSLNGARKPLGGLVSRTLKSKTHATALPGAPDGEYVVIQYTSSFENKKSAIETVTPMLDKDGKWRVSGYYIR